MASSSAPRRGRASVAFGSKAEVLPAGSAATHTIPFRPDPGYLCLYETGDEGGAACLRVSSNSHNLGVVRGSHEIQRVLQLTGVEDLLVLVDDPDDLVPPPQAG